MLCNKLEKVFKTWKGYLVRDYNIFCTSFPFCEIDERQFDEVQDKGIRKGVCFGIKCDGTILKMTHLSRSS